jgi:hypothetical protein
LEKAGAKMSRRKDPTANLTGSVFQRKGEQTWKIKFRGQFISTGQRGPKYGEGYMTAVEMLKHLNRKYLINEGKMPAPKKRETVAEVFEDFAEDKRGEGLQEITIKHYNLSLRKILGNLDRTIVDKAEIFKKAKQFLKSQELKATSKKIYLTSLKVFLNYCHETKLISLEAGGYARIAIQGKIR